MNLSAPQKSIICIHKFPLNQGMHTLDLLLANVTLYLNYFGNVKIYTKFRHNQLLLQLCKL